jgi:hypothetical protein
VTPREICEAYPSCQGPHPRRAFERIFREYGLPRAILPDSGSPFGSPGLARRPRLSLWWIRLGAGIERIVPGHPEQNGAHERMQRTAGPTCRSRAASAYTKVAGDLRSRPTTLCVVRLDAAVPTL